MTGLSGGYYLFKGRIISGELAPPGASHYAILVEAEGVKYRVAVNIRSSDKKFGQDLEFYLNEDFQHPIIDLLPEQPTGRHSLQGKELYLDYIRGNLFDRLEMKVMPSQLPGPDNDLNEKVDNLVRRATSDPDSILYAFGEPWGPENQPDKIFHFQPGNGIHNIHMNQGDKTGKFRREDGIHQDGGLILYTQGKYIAYFTKFQSQSWHTDDNGHAIDGAGVPIPPLVPDPDREVIIIRAMVNPVGGGDERETVTLRNTTDQPIDLTNWELVDKQKNSMKLGGIIGAGEERKIVLEKPVILSNKGGIISLLNFNGIKIHGVSYTKAQAKKEGVEISFV